MTSSPRPARNRSDPPEPHDRCAPSTIRVFVVDDHELVRRGLAEVLVDAGGITVVGEAGSAAEALRLIPPADPDVLLLDVRLPDGSGIEVCREIRGRQPSVRVLMLTSYEDEQALLASVLAGASGYALKQIRAPALVDAVRRVAAGTSLLKASDTSRVLGRPARSAGSGQPERALASLSGQELRVLDGIVDGLTNRQIAQRLSIAEQTVKRHVTNLLAKLGVEHRTQAAIAGAVADPGRQPWP